MLGLDAEPACRKTKQFDSLKDTPGEQHIPVIIDDPNLDSIHVEDVKSLLTVEEERIVDCRYHPLKLAPGEPTTIISNTFEQKAEPDALTVLLQNRLPWADFYKMVDGTFNTRAMVHIMAIMKRSVVLIAGANAIYLRLPGGSEDVPIQIFRPMDKDWIQDEHKAYYGKVKKGVRAKYPGFEDQLAKEAEKMEEWLATPEEKDDMDAAARMERWAKEWGSVRVEAPQVSLPSASSGSAASGAAPSTPRTSAPPVASESPPEAVPPANKRSKLTDALGPDGDLTGKQDYH